MHRMLRNAFAVGWYQFRNVLHLSTAIGSKTMGSVTQRELPWTKALLLIDPSPPWCTSSLPSAARTHGCSFCTYLGAIKSLNLKEENKQFHTSSFPARLNFYFHIEIGLVLRDVSMPTRRGLPGRSCRTVGTNPEL